MTTSPSERLERQNRVRSERELQGVLAVKLSRILRAEKGAIGGYDEHNARAHRIDSINLAINEYKRNQGRENDIAIIPVRFAAKGLTQESFEYTSSYQGMLDSMAAVLRTLEQNEEKEYSGVFNVKVTSILPYTVESVDPGTRSMQPRWGKFHRPAMVLRAQLQSGGEIDIPVQFIEMGGVLRRMSRKPFIEITSPSPVRAKAA